MVAAGVEDAADGEHAGHGRRPVRTMPHGRTLEWAAHRAGLGPVADVDEAGRGACCAR